MRIHNIKAILIAAVQVASLLLLGAATTFAQQTINLTAGPTTATMPDGSVVPMWGYSCGTAVTGATATCAALNPHAPAAVGTTPAGWSPVVITVPTGQNLTISLTNHLPVPPGATTGIPTSIMIVGQLGGGLGDVTQRTTTTSPDHSSLGSNSVSWPIAGTPGAFAPPVQGPRVQSFLTEVATGATTALTFGTPTNLLRPGTYLFESGTHPSIQGPMGLYGILVVTTAPAGTTAGIAYPAVAAVGTTPAVPVVNYNAEIPLLFSEIDPVQNKAVQTAVSTAGFSETTVWSGQPGGCGNASSAVGVINTCYPPAVNYTPLYFMINGVAFDRTHAATSEFSVTPNTGVTGNVLVRMVNAGSHMHVPSIVGSQTMGQTGATTAATPTTVTGFALIAEDGNPLPGVPRVQSDVFMAAGKVFDVMFTAPTAGAPALPVYDRELSLSGNATARDAGMLAYISINGGATPAALPAASVLAAAVARPDSYMSVVAGQTLTVSDPGKGVIANDTNVYGVTLVTPVTGLVLNTNGTFTYTGSPTTFTYCANGTVTAGVCSSGITAVATLGAATVEAASGITCTGPISYTSTIATYLAVKTPGVLATCKDAAGYPLTVNTATVATSGVTVLADANGGFTATTTGAGTPTFTFQAKNSQGTLSAPTTVSLTFPAGSGLTVTVVDGKDKTSQITDYKWIIEEDRTFYVDPNCTSNPPAAGCPTATSGTVPTFGTNFHTSNMPFVAQGCTGAQSCEAGQTVLGVASVCDVSNGVCRPGTQKTAVLPSQVHLDPSKRYYISVLPGDAADPFYGANSTGHGMGGAPIAATCGGSTGVTCTATTPFAPVTVLSQPSPYPPGKLSVSVFEDDFPLNGEQDSGGGIDVLATNEPGLGGFNLVLVDQAGRFGDVTGQMTYDMFNQPLSNGLAGTKDASTGLDACPISVNSRTGTNDPNQTGITGMIVTCPAYESDGKTLSPLAGQAVINNLMPGFFSVIATPGADRIARGEEWLQTNTLDGQKGHDAFIRIGEPAYFQEYGPAGYHDSIGFANPAIINGRKAGVCAGTDLNLTAANCTNSLTGKITGERLSRTPDERLYSSGSRDTYYWTQCYVSFGDPDGEDFAFAKCNADGTFNLSGLPDGNWRLTVFDQWNDQIVDGLSTPVFLSAATNPKCPGAGSSATVCNAGDIAEQQWQTNVYTRTFIDDNKDGVSQPGEAGIPLINTTVRFRDGSLANNLSTDFTGTANFNEEFPYFNWMVVEADTTRYKTTGIHTVVDAGGPADGSSSCGQTGYPPCGTSAIGKFLANTAEQVSLPTNLRVPGAVYCSNADCTGFSIANGPGSSTPSNCTGSPTGPATCGAPTLSTGRIDPPWVGVEAWQGYIGQNSFVEFGKTPYVAGENGGIHGHVDYASTRPFDDPQMLVQTFWTPLVPNVTINLYKEGFAADNVTPTLTLVDTTKTSSWDDWAQGFRSDGMPNMSCPGQSTADLFYFTLFNQPNYLNAYNAAHGGPAATALPYNSQFKCYDGMHDWNQVQPAPYDGMYSFPSVTSINPQTGKPAGTNCTGCTTNPDSTDTYRFGTPMLPAGKYVVEVVLPPGYELVKEEDKNILIGDNFIAPVTQEFGGLGNIFIIPDQAAVASTWSTGYNANNAQNPTSSLGTSASNDIVPGFVPEPTWPCVGEARIIPDYLSLFPQAKEVAPFAGATRNLCDRKEVTLGDQMGAIAKFYIYTSTHIAAKFTGIITDDFTSEFDPFSPTFGEKFSPPNMPVSFKDWTGAEVSRVYSDQWGDFNGMTYSSWEVNPPNPTGYSPTMMVTCMNDPGPIPGPNGTMITDPLFNPQYSQFCYENPYMPGSTQYMDTPVVPTSAFVSAGYNNVDCAYPALTPAIKEADGDGVGPWVSAAGHTLTITALGDQTVTNHAYAGPSAKTAPYNQKTVTRHYGFGTTKGTVSVGGVNVTSANITTWNDTTIVLKVPSGVPNCAVQQQAQYSGSTAQCGELVVTAANGKQSIDAVTITIGGKAPTRVTGPGPIGAGSIQAAIDAAAPGDLIIVSPGTYNELVIMWKPVRLQGVGGASSIINANTHPAGLLDPWRHRVDCLFGIAVDGQPYTSATGTNPFDSTGASSCPGTGWNYFTGGPNNPQVDRVPLEGIVGWDTTVNGNLAELLQEPSLLGAYEGAGITVLGKGVNIPAGSANVFGTGSEAGFPDGTTLLTASNCTTSSTNQTNPFTSNFQCNPSSIDGMGIVDSSQGGGGIALHAWNHNMQIANNRVYNNAGTLGGGITVGQGEYPEAYLAPNSNEENVAPGSCQDSAITNTQLPYCFNLNVNVHNNYVALNSSTGDELFSSTPAGAGGVNFCTGSDYYKFNYNWVCGNISTGDGGGVAHLGFSYNGDIEHNSILFNQSTNPTIPTNGGGLIVMGAAPDGSTLVNGVATECGSVTDVDCVPGLSDGAGPGLVINANLFQGNSADSGSGGAMRFQAVNGADIPRFPANPERWYSVLVTNNIITNNVAGWDGAGISLEDSLVVNVINNTVASNDTTATAGVLFNTLGAPLASSQSPAPNQCPTNPCSTSSSPQPAGLVSMQNSPQLTSSLTTGAVNCPTGHFQGGASTNGTCTKFSYPKLENNVFWQNSAYDIGVGALSAAYQQHIVTLYNAFTATPAPTQPQADAATANGSGVTITGGTGACVTRSYWDIGVRGDTGPTNHGSGIQLSASYSVLTAGGSSIIGSVNSSGDPHFISEYCNGSRTPPELGAAGWAVPPGVSDATVPNPIFNLSPGATVDEGNNWINMSWGPLSLSNPVTSISTSNTPLGNYGPADSNSSVDGRVSCPSTNYTDAPNLDFYGTVRKVNNNCGGGSLSIDAGAVEFVPGGGPAALSVTPTSLAFGNQGIGSTSAAQSLTLSNTGATGATGIAVVVTAPFSRPTGTAGGTCTATLAAGATCTINVVYSPTATVTSTGSATITANVTVIGSPVTLTGTGVTAAAVLAVTPTSLAFGNQPVGSSSAAQTLTLRNTGTAGATGIGLTFTGPYARATAGGTCTTTLAAATSCTINVTFHPTATGSAPGTLAIAASVSVSGSPVTLTGTGVTAAAVLAVTPTSLAFGNQAVGSSSAAQTLTLRNTGTAGATGIGLTFTGPYARATAGGTCTTTLAAATSCTINVTFHPTATGSAPGTLAIAASVSVSGSPVTLTGNGTNGTLVGIATFSGPTPSLVTGAGTAHSGTVTVTNTATGATAGPLTMTGAPGINKNFGPGQFSISGTCGSSTVLNPGASCTIIVQYDPGGVTTTASATVEIFVTGQANQNPNYTFSAN